jgi:tetratricopeptide (TPR) repeat protein
MTKWGPTILVLVLLPLAGCRSREVRDEAVFETVWTEPRSEPVPHDLTRFDVARERYLAGDFGAAIKVCNALLADGARDAGVSDLSGLAKAAQGKHKKAILDFNLAIATDPLRGDLRFHRGNSWFLLKDFRVAERDYTDALGLEETAAAHNNRGNARGALGDWAMAVVDYNAAIELDPNLGPAYRNRSRARARLGDEEGMREDQDRGRELEPHARPKG